MSHYHDAAIFHDEATKKFVKAWKRLQFALAYGRPDVAEKTRSCGALYILQKLAVKEPMEAAAYTLAYESRLYFGEPKPKKDCMKEAMSL